MAARINAILRPQKTNVVYTFGTHGMVDRISKIGRRWQKIAIFSSLKITSHYSYDRNWRPHRIHEVSLQQRIPIGNGKTTEARFNHAADANRSRSNDSDRDYLLGNHHGDYHKPTHGLGTPADTSHLSGHSNSVPFSLSPPWIYLNFVLLTPLPHRPLERCAGLSVLDPRVAIWETSLPDVGLIGHINSPPLRRLCKYTITPSYNYMCTSNYVK